MKKKSLGLIALLVATTATTFVYSNKTNNDLQFILRNNVTLNNVESLSNDDIDGNTCLSGGPGAISCSLGGGIGVGGVNGDMNCSVTCADGYYACCGAGCKCVKY